MEPLTINRGYFHSEKKLVTSTGIFIFNDYPFLSYINLDRADQVAMMLEFGIPIYIYGKLHCDSGPAFVNGELSIWYQNGKRHRLNGPAININNSNFYWFYDDQLHRTDGPAVSSRINPSIKDWYIHGVRFDSKEEWFENLEIRDKLKVIWIFDEI